ncbi:MAG: helix-turn-helix transcriptional regulator [Actinoplanes sp.]
MSADSNSAFAEELRRLRTEAGLSYRELAGKVTPGKSYLHELETGAKPPNPAIARRLDAALAACGRLIATLRSTGADDDAEAEIEGWELARRVIASDVGPETLDRLERAVDQFAMAYAGTPPSRPPPTLKLS